MDAPLSLGARLKAIALLRCPRCAVGKVFRGALKMNDPCPACGLKFERDTGYFLGAMYFSYALAIPAIAFLTLIAYLIWPKWHLYQQVLVAWAVTIPLVPAIFRYSRVMWLHFDNYFDPQG